MKSNSRDWPLGRCLGIVLLLTLACAGSVTAQEISWIAPEDGGTPRDPHNIERIGAAEFRIRAVFEEGGPSALRHALSRMDLICRNTGPTPEIVTARIDLSDAGKRTDYDSRPEAGMQLRDIVFIQAPGESWRQIDGTTEGWVATVKFLAQPGDTKVGLSPWYTYADLLAFFKALPSHPHLNKEIIGRSDGGREHWELTVSDPSIPSDHKDIIFWHAREHAYETWSSFAMEGLVNFLLSAEAAEFRRRYVLVLHPMTNVDGVAQGFEYRGGYDFPDPRGTATARLTFETIDRLRPGFAVAWHNWIAPRDRNVVFYTDGQDGKPAARVWWRFTQLFRSLRAADHRWKDEATPLKYNWEGRRPLSEANPHQYAMKKYGTRVWGWEMPWWNYTPAEARQMGGEFALAFLTTIGEPRAGAALAPEQKTIVETPRWEFHEFAVKGRTRFGNAFRDTCLVGEFTSPSGKTRILDGFYDGDDVWRLRFAPDEEGDWSYLLRGEGVDILQQGQLRCTSPRGRGFIRIHPENPHAFACDDGSAFFPMGDTCYGLFDDSPITPELRGQYLEVRRRHGFNFVRMTVGHSEFRAATNSAYWAWGGSTSRPDLDRLNPAFFAGLDRLFLELKGRGMNIELILLNFYRRPFTDTNLWTQARERLWIRYLTARYSAFNNLFLWTLANEYETHPDGRYRLDYPSDVEWAKATARYVKAHDAHRHLVTVHPVISASRLGDTPRAPFDTPWRIGEFFGNELALDVLSQQTGAQGSGVFWSDQWQCWTGDSAELSASVTADRQYRKPVLNTEFGYEYLRGHPPERKQVHHTDKVRRSAWRIICAGGYFAAGFHGTIGHSDVWNRIDAPNHYTFAVQDEGAATQLSALYQFFNGLPFWRMQPFAGVSSPAVALAEAGHIYVVYFPTGGEATVDLTAAKLPLSAQWLNPRSGAFTRKTAVLSATAPLTFRAPDTNDWTLIIR